MTSKTLFLGSLQQNCLDTQSPSEICPISGGGKPSTEMHNASPRRYYTARQSVMLTAVNMYTFPRSLCQCYRVIVVDAQQQ